MIVLLSILALAGDIEVKESTFFCPNNGYARLDDFGVEIAPGGFVNVESRWDEGRWTWEPGFQVVWWDFPPDYGVPFIDCDPGWEMRVTWLEVS